MDDYHLDRAIDEAKRFSTLADHLLDLRASSAGQDQKRLADEVEITVRQSANDLALILEAITG